MSKGLILMRQCSNVKSDTKKFSLINDFAPVQNILFVFKQCENCRLGPGLWLPRSPLHQIAFISTSK